MFIGTSGIEAVSLLLLVSMGLKLLALTSNNAVGLYLRVNIQ